MTSITTSVENPFAVLGIAATLDPAEVKRAYFTALPRHPPHADPQGFRRIRDAYEALQGEGLRAAHLRAPLSVSAGTGTADLLAARAAAVAQSQARGATTAGVAAFERLLGLDWSAVIARHCAT